MMSQTVNSTGTTDDSSESKKYRHRTQNLFSLPKEVNVLCPPLAEMHKLFALHKVPSNYVHKVHRKQMNFILTVDHHDISCIYKHSTPQNPRYEISGLKNLDKGFMLLVAKNIQTNKHPVRIMCYCHIVIQREPRLQDKGSLTWFLAIQVYSQLTGNVVVN